MPVEIRVDLERKRVLIELSGVLDIDEMVRAVEDVVHHPDFEPGFDLFSDHTRIDEAITTDQLEAFVGHLEKHAGVLGGARWAIVTEMAVSYGMMRVLSVKVQSIPMEVAVFRTVKEAEGWLASERLASGR